MNVCEYVDMGGKIFNECTRRKNFFSYADCERRNLHTAEKAAHHTRTKSSKIFRIDTEKRNYETKENLS